VAAIVHRRNRIATLNQAYCPLYQLRKRSRHVRDRSGLDQASGAGDEATTYWLKNDRPFDPDAIVEVIIELLVTSLRCAAQLDPEIDVSNAVAKLADFTA
jgi:hypothetical protein